MSTDPSRPAPETVPDPDKTAAPATPPSEQRPAGERLKPPAAAPATASKGRPRPNLGAWIGEKIGADWAAVIVASVLVLLAVSGTYAQTGLREIGKSPGTPLPDIEYVLWAIMFGLVIRNTGGVPAPFRPGVATYET